MMLSEGDVIYCFSDSPSLDGSQLIAQATATTTATWQPVRPTVFTKIDSLTLLLLPSLSVHASSNSTPDFSRGERNIIFLPL
ncbi:unnamed protein product [Rodentolepis nana]|uniref:Uncharacterized protein n=1 Tax=Rodentolepis nana TaxID=102285 RepID=A0A0R3T519_RODNA|nr:unnamed protein product [Rodentolepis nana]